MSPAGFVYAEKKYTIFMYTIFVYTEAMVELQRTDAAVAESPAPDSTPFAIPVEGRRHVRHDESPIKGYAIVAVLGVAVFSGVIAAGTHIEDSGTPAGSLPVAVQASSTSSVVASEAPNQDGDVAMDLENWFAYVRPQTMAEFIAQYPDAICIDGETTCISELAASAACTKTPCQALTVSSQNGRIKSVLATVNPTVGAFVVLKTDEKYGPPDLVENLQLDGMQSQHSSWFIKGGTFTVTNRSGYDYSGTPIASDISLGFREGTAEPVSKLTRLPVSSAAATTLIQMWRGANDTCRGGLPEAAETIAACHARDVEYGTQLQAANYCYGRQGEYDFERSWHACGPRSCKLGSC
jgi:hypothetical protein